MDALFLIGLFCLGVICWGFVECAEAAQRGVRR